MTHKEFGGHVAQALGHSREGEDSPLIPRGSRRRTDRTVSNLSSNLSSGNMFSPEPGMRSEDSVEGDDLEASSGYQS